MKQDVQDAHFGNNNEFLHKYSALEILERINNGEKTELIDPMEGDKPLV